MTEELKKLMTIGELRRTQNTLALEILKKRALLKRTTQDLNKLLDSLTK